MEVCYLLIYGSLPDLKELQRFERLVVSEMMVHENLGKFF
jgi:citrate synthase